MELDKFLKLNEQEKINHLLTLDEKVYSDFMSEVKKVESKTYRKLIGQVNSAKQQQSLLGDPSQIERKNKSLYRDDSSVADNLDASQAQNTKLIDLSSISPNPYQPRLYFDQGKIEDLAYSIKEHGLLENIYVSINSQNQEVTLVAGERRVRAYRFLQKKFPNGEFSKIQASFEYDITKEKLRELAEVENDDREDLTHLENALKYIKEMEQDGLSQTQLLVRYQEKAEDYKKKHGKEIPDYKTIKSSSQLSRYFNISKLPKEVLNLAMRYNISIKTLDILTKTYPQTKEYILTSDQQLDFIEKINCGEINQKELASLINNLANPKPNPEPIESKIIEDVYNTYKSVSKQTKKLETHISELSSEKQSIAKEHMIQMKILQEKILNL